MDIAHAVAVYPTLRASETGATFHCITRPVNVTRAS